MKKSHVLLITVTSMLLFAPANFAEETYKVGDRVTTTDYSGTEQNGIVTEVCGPPLTGCYKVLFDYQSKDGNPILVRYYPQSMRKEGSPPYNAATAAQPAVSPVATRNKNIPPARQNMSNVIETANSRATMSNQGGMTRQTQLQTVGQIPPRGAGKEIYPEAEKPMHGAPRGPAAKPSLARGAQPSESFLRQLVMSKQEMNSGGRTLLMNIHVFAINKPRNSAWQEYQPARNAAKVIPIYVEWTDTSYGQTDDYTQDQKATWICWQNEAGVWFAATTGDITAGELKTVDHPSIM